MSAVNPEGQFMGQGCDYCEHCDDPIPPGLRLCDSCATWVDG